MGSDGSRERCVPCRARATAILGLLLRSRREFPVRPFHVVRKTMYFWLATDAMMPTTCTGQPSAPTTPLVRTMLSCTTAVQWKAVSSKRWRQGTSWHEFSAGCRGTGSMRPTHSTGSWCFSWHCSTRRRASPIASPPASVTARSAKWQRNDWRAALADRPGGKKLAALFEPGTPGEKVLTDPARTAQLDSRRRVRPQPHPRGGRFNRQAALDTSCRVHWARRCPRSLRFIVSPGEHTSTRITSG